MKNLDLSYSDARDILNALLKKIPLVKDIHGPLTLGVAARTVAGKEKLIREGYFIRDLSDLGIGG